MKAIFLFALSALISVSTVSAQVCASTYLAESRKCFTDRGLALAPMPNNIDVLHPRYEALEVSFTGLDPGTHCTNETEYQAAAECSVNVLKNCFDPEGTAGMTPDPALVSEGMQIICQHKEEIDFACYRTFFQAVSECVDYNFQKNARFTDPQQQLVCLSSDLSYDCIRAIIRPMCGKGTADVYLEQTDKYQIPSACMNGTEPSRTDRQPYFDFFSEPEAVPAVGSMDSGAGTVTSATILSVLIVPLMNLIFC